jgi:LEA14-like dessication related protein
LMALILGTTYVLCFQSTRGLQIETASFYRDHALSSDAEFVIKARIRNTGSFGISLCEVRFELMVDNISFPAIQTPGFSISRGQSLEYTLRFVIPNNQDTQFLNQINRYEVALTIKAWVASGIYSGMVAASDTRTWNWVCKL